MSRSTAVGYFPGAGIWKDFLGRRCGIDFSLQIISANLCENLKASGSTSAQTLQRLRLTLTRRSHYISDWTDGFKAHIHILAPSTYIFFASGAHPPFPLCSNVVSRKSACESSRFLSDTLLRKPSQRTTIFLIGRLSSPARHHQGDSSSIPMEKSHEFGYPLSLSFQSFRPSRLGSSSLMTLRDISTGSMCSFRQRYAAFCKRWSEGSRS